MKRLLPALLVLSLSSQALADPPAPVKSIPPGEDKIVIIRKDEKAPFSGQLFDTDTAIRWGNWLEQYRFRLELDKETQDSIHQAQINYLNQVIKIEQEKYKETTEVQRQTIMELEKKAAEPDPWYESFQTGLVVGVVCTVVVGGIAVALVNTASK